MQRYFLWGCIFLFSSFLPAEPDESDSIKVKYTFNPIVKIATKTSGAQRDLAASVSVIDQAGIQSSPTSQVFELVGQQIPGLYVTEWGLMGFGVAGQAAGKISIRGMGGGANTHVLILRNGRPDFMGLMGCTVADEFSTQGVERIEILRGPGSFLYGTNATGGVINIVSRKMQHAGFETTVHLGSGSYATQHYAISHGAKINRLDYYMTAARDITDGHREDANAGYQGNHYTGHFGYALNENTQIDMNMTLANIELFDPGRISAPKTNDWYDLDRYGGDVTFTRFDRFGETNIKLHGNFGVHRFFDGWKSKDRLIGVIAYQTLKPWTGNTLTTGFDLKEYGGDAKDASEDYDPFYITEYAPYLYIQQLFGSRFLMSGGLRLEHHELYGWETLPKLGLVYHLSAKNALRLSAAKGFRSPSIRELYFWMPANDALTPDRLWNYELGITQEIRNQLKIEAVIFQSEGSNLIQFNAPPPRWVNGGSYTHRGIEMTGTWMLSNFIQFNSAWTWMDMNEDACNIPRQKLSFSGQIQWKRFTINGQLLSVIDWKSAEFPTPSPVPVLHDMKDYTVANLSLYSEILHGTGLKFTVKNIFDTDYQSMYGYPMPGRTLHGMMVFKF